MTNPAIKFAAIGVVSVQLIGSACSQKDTSRFDNSHGATPVLESLRDGLIGYWKFEDNGDDSSLSRYKLNLQPGMQYESGMRGSRAPRVPREDKYYIRGSVDFAEYDFGDRTFTLQVWVKFNSQTHQQVLLEKVDGPGWTLTKLRDHRLRFDAGPIGVTSDVIEAFEKDGWHQVVVRRREQPTDRHVTELFVDSYLVAQRPAYRKSETIPDSPEPLLIGKRWKHDDKGFDGWIDEVAIWNRGLSEVERASLWGDGRGIDIP